MIFRKYIIKEVAITAVAVLMILALIYVSGRYVEYLGDAASGKLGRDMILKMMGLKLVNATVQLIPICMFFAVLLVLGRMKQSQELVTIYASGIGRNFVMKTVSITAFAFAVVVFILAFFTAPWSEQRSSDLEARANAEADINGIAAGRFKELRDGNRIVYVSELSEDRSRMQGVFMQYREEETLGLVKAKEATLKEDENASRHLVLHNGSRYIGKGNNLDFTVTDFETYSIRLDQKKEDPRNKLSAVSTAELMAQGDNFAVAELQWRLSFPLATIMLALLGAAMTLGHGRETRYGNIILALLIFFLYRNLLAIARSLIKSGEIDGVIGLWWVHAIMLVTIVLVFNKDRLPISWKKQKIAPRGAR
jgi:lipopolysaccharide export system permease protein